LGEITSEDMKLFPDVSRAPAHSLGLGGDIKTYPSDFIVEEVWEKGVCTVNHPLSNRIVDQLMIRVQKRNSYLHFTLVKQNWDTWGALNYIGRKIGMSLKRFGISGMKDKRAVTAQRISIWKADAKIIARLKMKHLTLKDFRYADERINLGNSLGNQFTITIRNIPHTQEQIGDILKRFKKIVSEEGVLNYYGPQRFEGQNAEVGEALKEGTLKKATEIILGKVHPFLVEGTIDTVPNVYWYEKKMLRHLQKFPNDYAGALRRIPKKILRIYVHAYQSKIFNTSLQRASIENKIPENISVPGFQIPRMPELKTMQIERKSILKADQFTIIKASDHTAVLRFRLGSGEYATTLLSYLIDNNNEALQIGL